MTVEQQDTAAKLGAEKATAENLPAEKLMAERLAAERLIAENLTVEKRMTEKLLAEKAAAKRISWQVGFWLGVFAVFLMLMWWFSGVLLPFIAAIVIGYLLDPVVNALQRLGIGRAPATLLILALVIFAIVIVFILIVPVLAHQLSGFVQSLPDILNKLQSLIAAAAERLAKDYGGVLLEKLRTEGGSAPDIHTSINDLVGEAARWSATFLNSLVARGVALVSLVSLIVVTPVVAFYILLDWHMMIATLASLVPPRNRATVSELAREIDNAIAGFLRGQSLVCLFLGAWYGLGLTLVGVNFGFLIGISAGFLSFIPYVGSLTALVVGTIVAVVQGWPNWHLPALALAVVVAGQFLEGNVLGPKLVGNRVGLHPVWLIFALLAFGSLFGFLGLIVAVPLAAAAGVLLRFAVKRYRTSTLYTDLPPAYSQLLQKTPAETPLARGG